VTVHSEYALLCDIVIATEDAYFEDAPHPAFGIVPGDDLHISRPWPGLPGTRPLASEKRTMMIDL
jgi:enoyl-CoA hydratase/carnithine racemase